MNSAWNTALRQATVLTFETLCFLVADPEVSPPQELAAHEATVRLDFVGPFAGTLELRLFGDLLPVLVENMLGDDGTRTRTEQLDALGEITNVIGGNTLPAIAGVEAVFEIGPPAPAPTPEPLLAETPCAEAQVGLEHGRVEVRLYRTPAVAPEARECRA